MRDIVDLGALIMSWIKFNWYALIQVIVLAYTYEHHSNDRYANISPQTEGSAEETRLSLEIRSQRWLVEWNLVNMLASWSSEEKGLQKEAIMLKTMTNKVAIYLNVFGELVTKLSWVMRIELQLL